MRKRILVISQYYFPEQFRINDICQELVKKGNEVTVLTGIPNYPQGRFYSGYNWFKKRQEIINGVNIKRFPIIARGNHTFSLVLNYFSFVVSVWLHTLFLENRFDSIFVYEVSPMTQALPGVWLSKRFGCPCSIYVMDLWPENVISITGLKNKIVIHQLNAMVDYIYNNCRTIFVPSIGFKSNLMNRNVNPEKIIYWPQFAEDIYQPVVPRKADDNELRIIFAGNIGVAQGLDILPVVARKIKEDETFLKKILFILVGDGRNKQELVSKINQLGVSSFFQFIDKQPMKMIPKLFSEADVCLISLSENPIFDNTVPAKAQSCMACGMPLLVCANGEMQRIIEESNSGVWCPAGDAEGMISCIKRLSKIHDMMDYRKNSLNYYRENFDKEKLILQLQSIL